MVLKLCQYTKLKHKGFENDVEMYGAQTYSMLILICLQFENDVEMYGAQTNTRCRLVCQWFENDVEMYGAQTIHYAHLTFCLV